MRQIQEVLSLGPRSRGLHDITPQVDAVVRESEITTGLCHVFIPHTSASLLIQENADPSAARDLEAWFERHAPDGDSAYKHTAEGPDDMPGHIRAALTATTETIPVVSGRLGLGTGQGLFLFEHRLRVHSRNVTVHILGA